MKPLSSLAPKTRRLIKIMPSGCWEWQGHRVSTGYGSSRDGSAHRSVYKRLVGPVAPSLVLDHLCRNPPCVNPEHLEPVTQAVNMARSEPALRTRCVNGHEFSDANTYIRPDGRRMCRPCCAARQRARRVIPHGTAP